MDDIKIGKITYVQGDATAPQGDGKRFIIHCCNDVGGWGAGFVVALSKKWPITRERYKEWHKTVGLQLGNIQAVKVEPNLYVINMIGQRDMGYKDGLPPIRYGAIGKCLNKVSHYAKQHNATIHCPYLMGCGLAGGDWNKIEELLTIHLINNGISLTLYDIDNKRGSKND